MLVRCGRDAGAPQRRPLGEVVNGEDVGEVFHFDLLYLEPCETMGNEGVGSHSFSTSSSLSKLSAATSGLPAAAYTAKFTGGFSCTGVRRWD